MKKIVLLFILLCTGALTGMEQKTALDREVEKYEESTNKLNLEQFTALVHKLVVEFNNIPIPIHVASKFNSQVAKMYNTLCSALVNEIAFGQDIASVKELLESGADADCAPLLSIITSKENPSAQMIKLLLDHGANPFMKDPRGQTPLEWVNYTINKLQELLPGCEEVKSTSENTYNQISLANEYEQLANKFVLAHEKACEIYDKTAPLLRELLSIKALLEEAMKKTTAI